MPLSFFPQIQLFLKSEFHFMTRYSFNFCLLRKEVASFYFIYFWRVTGIQLKTLEIKILTYPFRAGAILHRHSICGFGIYLKSKGKLCGCLLSVKACAHIPPFPTPTSAPVMTSLTPPSARVGNPKVRTALTQFCIIILLFLHVEAISR